MMFLGFDTSNYTTSVGAVDDRGYQNIRSILPVKEGERGIRQSDGVFLHTKNISSLFNKLNIEDTVGAVGISTRPRSVDGSYMPVFAVGEAFGRGIAKAFSVPVYEFSHQDGHIMEGIYSANAHELLEEDFMSLHLSGGTTEILKTLPKNNFTHQIIGGTTDISAGQYIDRIGVKLGLPFPCGVHLEKLCYNASGVIPMPVSVNGTNMSFSGVETKMTELIGKYSSCDIAFSVLKNIAAMLIKSLNNAIRETNIHKLLIVGGVASNSLIRDELSKKVDAMLYFATPELSSDNAVGISCLAKLKWRNKWI